ncbi:hypothetical protein IWZ00DRAFT_6962 [Phyllosticta capitalensis]
MSTLGPGTRMPSVFMFSGLVVWRVDSTSPNFISEGSRQNPVAFASLQDVTSVRLAPSSHSSDVMRCLNQKAEETRRSACKYFVANVSIASGCTIA